jgi:hypothetical protein
MIDQATRDLICERIASGESLRGICRELGTPSQALVLKEVLKDDAFREQYTRARETQADVLADEIVQISDDGTNDWMVSNDPENPGYRFNGEHSSRSRLRVDARKWFASKVAPKKYGERLDLNHGGGIVLRELSDVERVAKILSFVSQVKRATPSEEPE